MLYHLWSSALSDQLLPALTLTLTLHFHSDFNRFIVNMVNPDGRDPANTIQDFLIFPELPLPGIQRDPAHESLCLQCDEIGRQLTLALEQELTPDDPPDSLRPVIRLFRATDSEGLCFIRRLIFQGRHRTLLFDPEDIETVCETFFAASQPFLGSLESTVEVISAQGLFVATAHFLSPTDHLRVPAGTAAPPNSPSYAHHIAALGEIEYADLEQNGLWADSSSFTSVELSITQEQPDLTSPSSLAELLTAPAFTLADLEESGSPATDGTVSHNGNNFDEPSWLAPDHQDQQQSYTDENNSLPHEHSAAHEQSDTHNHNHNHTQEQSQNQQYGQDQEQHNGQHQEQHQEQHNYNHEHGWTDAATERQLLEVSSLSTEALCVSVWYHTRELINLQQIFLTVDTDDFLLDVLSRVSYINSQIRILSQVYQAAEKPYKFHLQTYFEKARDYLDRIKAPHPVGNQTGISLSTSAEEQAHELARFCYSEDVGSPTERQRDIDLAELNAELDQFRAFVKASLLHHHNHHNHDDDDDNHDDEDDDDDDNNDDEGNDDAASADHSRSSRSNLTTGNNLGARIELSEIINTIDSIRAATGHEDPNLNEDPSDLSEAS